MSNLINHVNSCDYSGPLATLFEEAGQKSAVDGVLIAVGLFGPPKKLGTGKRDGDASRRHSSNRSSVVGRRGSSGAWSFVESMRRLPRKS